MKTVNFILRFAFLFMILTSCSKENFDINNLKGTWYECYDDVNYSMDGSLEYTFFDENRYELTVYDVFSDKETITEGTYLYGTFGDREINLDPMYSDKRNVGYNIVKLTKNEMAWQKVGTSYSPGTIGSDYRHFRR